MDFPPPLPTAVSDELADLVENERGVLPVEATFVCEDAAVDATVTASQEVEKMEQILAEDFNKLSLMEHEKVLFDMHGLPLVDQEDPEDIDDLLEDMERRIKRIRRKRSYDKAKAMDGGRLVKDRSFRLMFLRCDRFESKVAAQRIVRHFEVKEELFGDGEVLGRDVRISDLSHEDVAALESGFFQMLPVRDNFGRSILFVAPAYRPKETSTKTCGRLLWYVMHTAVKDEETQRKGVVVILCKIGGRKSVDPMGLVLSIHHIRTGIPKRLAGFHFCFDDNVMRPFVASLRLIMPRNEAVRFRPHFGDRETLWFRLQTYGIPTNHLPFLSTDKLSLAWHREWLAIRRAQEEPDSVKDNVVFVPHRFDVLFGRGSNTREYTGNFRATHIVEMHQAEYERAGKFEKTAIAERIVRMIHESQGRFLKWEKCGWVEVDDEVAREKISHFFRRLRSKAPKNANSDAMSSSSDRSAKRGAPDPSHLQSPANSDGRSISTEEQSAKRATPLPTFR